MIEKYKKRIGILIVFVCALFLIMWNMFNYKEVNSRLAFAKSDITTIWIFDSNNHGLSYDYKLSDNEAQKINDELVNCKKKIVNMSETKKGDYSITFLIILNAIIDGQSIEPDRTITLFLKDEKSVYALLRKSGNKDRLVVVESKELSSYLKNTLIQLKSQTIE
jgi:hypothetical protein